MCLTVWTRTKSLVFSLTATKRQSTWDVFPNQTLTLEDSSHNINCNLMVFLSNRLSYTFQYVSTFRHLLHYPLCGCMSHPPGTNHKVCWCAKGCITPSDIVSVMTTVMTTIWTNTCEGFLLHNNLKIIRFQVKKKIPICCSLTHFTSSVVSYLFLSYSIFRSMGGLLRGFCLGKKEKYLWFK